MRTPVVGKVVAASLVVGLAAFAVPAALADSNSNCTKDSTDSVKACLYQVYDVGSAGANKPTYSLTNYHFVLTALAPQVSVTQAVSHAGVSGKTPSGKAYAEVAGQHTWTSPSYGTTYTYKPSWVGEPIIIPDGSIFYQCANLYVTLKRGGTTWTFHTPNVCIGAIWMPPVV